MTALGRDPEVMAKELLAIADRTGPDGEPLYSKSEIREALPLLLAVSCPLEGNIVIPDDIASLLDEALGAQPRKVSRKKLTEIVHRHYQRHPPTSPFVEAINRLIVQWCMEAKRDACDASNYTELLGLTSSGTTTKVDDENVFRGSAMAQLRMKALRH